MVIPLLANQDLTPMLSAQALVVIPLKLLVSTNEFNLKDRIGMASPSPTPSNSMSSYEVIIALDLLSRN